MGFQVTQKEFHESWVVLWEEKKKKKLMLKKELMLKKLMLKGDEGGKYWDFGISWCKHNIHSMDKQQGPTV